MNSRPNSGELAYINWVRRQILPDSRILIGPGDDAALIRLTGRDAIITTDMLLDGSCFRLDEAGPYRVGRKAMAVNLSDIAAMAAQPVATFVSVGLPRSGGQTIAKELLRGIKSMADEFDTALAGGDTNSWDGPLVISITVIGEPTGRGAVRRKGAKPGDWLFVTGPLGGSIRGRHLDFTPRIREAQRLHDLVELRAMIDISDGLAVDLGKLCQESGCGAVLRAESIPISDDARNMGDGLSPLDHALADGEDFELLFAVSSADGEKLLAERSISHIGECEASGLWIERDGSRQPLELRGYEHVLD
jgi:thiamine-monophosphate kinase